MLNKSAPSTSDPFATYQENCVKKKLKFQEIQDQKYH
jgi:hypothetical protein